ncbi:hypothetical protein Q8A67_014020 [Cirrhinus molitorella]|uniref:Fibrinogen C-terminal domain-containing protein n=1 Tax=Cirrhinus molitorella TaxID=172907 RepID=A0AA88PQM9_9TELE|nr:hypothetical protein Q8A67_014020 [Cirrhinus molitorella]
MRALVVTEGSLQLLLHREEKPIYCRAYRKGAAALMHREGEPVRCRVTHVTARGLTLQPKGAATLLHQKGEPCPMLDEPGDLEQVMEGLSLRLKGAAALLHRDGEPILHQGAVALLHRKRESPLRSSMCQVEGSHCDRREPQPCCTGRESPIRHGVQRAPDPLSWTSEAMIANMIVLLCLSAVLMGADVVKSDSPRAKDCSDIYANGYRASGVYNISTIDGPVQVYCEMASGGLNDQGYWTVILRRTDQEVNFFRGWRSYKWGFGNKEHDYWLGLEFLHQLTRRHQYRLRVDMEDFQGQKAYAVYRFFSVDSEADGYKLHVSGFVNGGAGDSLYFHNGMKFTTFDKDQDRSPNNCANTNYGGFWYYYCSVTNPTGPYLWEKEGTTLRNGVNWLYWKNSWNSLKSMTMKIRLLMGADVVKSDSPRAKDCSDIYASGYRTSGVYTISTIDGPVQVYCEMASGGLNDQGYWTVILRRTDQEVNFFRGWRSYKWGFGNKEHDYWLGLEFLHQLTRRHQYRLRVDMEDFQGQKAYAVYRFFSVDSEADGYKLHVSGFVNGGAGDSLSYHNGMKFTTFDKDQDLLSGNNCAKRNQGAFWYNDCSRTNPTAQYFEEKESIGMITEINWYNWKNSWQSLKSITMKIRRAPDPLSWTSEAMIANMIVLLCLSAVLMGADVVKSDSPRAKDCSDIYASGYRTSGVYTISTIDGPVQVYCEMASGGLNEQGYWTVILRRTDDEVNFFRAWRSYKWGFGNKEGDYWLGLEFLHQLTRRHQYRLRVDLEDFQGRKAYAVYRFFSVGSEADGYKLQVSGFVNGGAGDSLSYHNGMKFSTFDKDQDLSDQNCALKYYQGGFWYNSCYKTNPTGHYLQEKDNTVINIGATWYFWKNSWHSLKSITMKIRREK